MTVAIFTKYLGPTNTRGARIQAKACGHGRMTVSYDDMMGSEWNHTAAARQFAVESGLLAVAGYDQALWVGATTEDGMVFVRTDGRPWFIA